MGQFGEELRKERVARGVALETISEKTKVVKRYLTALETEHFEILPGGIPSKGIMRSYARTVGIDEAAWVERFLDASREHGVAENENGWTEFVQNVGRSRARRRHRGEWLRRFTGVGLFVLILASFGWLVWQYVSARALAETTAPHSISSTVATSPNGNPTTQ
jgi:cytoskeleton protein RodZ